MRAWRPAAILTGMGLLGAGGIWMARALRRSGARVDKAFTIEGPAAELFAAWRDPQNLRGLLSVLGRIEIVDAEPDRKVAWRAVGCQAVKAGSVTFAPAPGDRGTEVRVAIEPSGPFVDGALASRVESDLRRYKAKTESGEVAVNGTDVRA